MKPPTLIILTSVVLVAGCIPLRQVSQVAGPAHPEVKALYDRSLLVGFDLHREKVDTASSFIESPSGQRYRLEVQPHQFDVGQQRPYLSALLSPLTADGGRLQGWRNGIWSFHFVVETHGVVQVIDQKWKYYYFYYFPLIHGAPN